MSRLIPVSLLLLCALPLFAARHRAALPVVFPTCSIVEGTPAVTFSRDGGQTLAAIGQRLEGIGYTFGLAALDAKTLLSIHNDMLSLSTDAGCHWVNFGKVVFDNPFPPQIAAAGPDRAYIWSDSRPNLARFLAGTITILKPPVDIVGLGVDRANAEHLRIGGDDGSVWDSVNGGGSWTQLGIRAFTATNLIYRAAFDPANLDHVVFGASSKGAMVTFDGARSWAPVTGLGSGTNVFSLVVSPADPKIVWAMAINLAEADANAPSQGRHIYRSVDGGASFTPVIDNAPGVHLTNGPLIVAHPTDPDVLYFVFGTYFDGYGTDLFRYAAAAQSLTVMHHPYDAFDAIAFSPADPSLMYFGLEVVQRTSP